jgi:hypothetical protein
MLKKKIKAVIMHTVIRDMIRDYRRWRPYIEWLESGKPVPAPHIIKEIVVKEYANKYGTKVFIESGTYLGDMVNAVRKTFERIYSIELDSQLYQKAKAQFSNSAHISIFFGDSSKVMPEILKHITEPCLFWLDGHYSAGITRGEKETPVLQELEYIFSHPNKNHVVLIDDARCFIGNNDYPTVPELQTLVLSQKPECEMKIEYDIIRIHRK